MLSAAYCNHISKVPFTAAFKSIKTVSFETKMTHEGDGRVKCQKINTYYLNGFESSRTVFSNVMRLSRLFLTMQTWLIRSQQKNYIRSCLSHTNQNILTFKLLRLNFFSTTSLSKIRELSQFSLIITWKKYFGITAYIIIFQRSHLLHFIVIILVISYGKYIYKLRDSLIIQLLFYVMLVILFEHREVKLTLA